jgi:predicted PurR-regulated permease PerM
MASEPSKSPIPNAGLSTSQAPSGPTASAPKDAKAVNKRKRTVVNRAVLLLACAFASLFFPFYKVLLKFFRGNRGIAAMSCCVLLVLGLMVPVYFLGYLVLHQLLTLYQSIEPTVQAYVKGGNSGFLARIDGMPILAWLTHLGINWQGTMLDTLRTAGAATERMVNKTSLGALEIIVDLLVTLFIMFYLFMDGERIAKKFRMLLPMRAAYQDMIIARFLLVSRATVKGTLVIAFIQGALGAIILLIFGVKSWILWGIVMIALGLIPMMGTWLVLLPVGVIQMATGHVWQGVVILALNFGVVSTIENILRPRLVGQSARMHDLLIFFSTIGGLAVFGPIGAITGPVIMAFFFSITEIYTMELREHFGGMD